MPEPDTTDGPRACPFCGCTCDPEGWLDGDGTRGPECEGCGATAQSLAAWNMRQADEQARKISDMIGELYGENQELRDRVAELEAAQKATEYAMWDK
jgi:hypothetical protein